MKASCNRVKGWQMLGSTESFTKPWLPIPARSLHAATGGCFERLGLMRPHIHARAFCRALLEQSREADAWYPIAVVGERLGVEADQGLALARECVRRSWIEQMADSVRLRAEGRQVALQRLSFTGSGR